MNIALAQINVTVGDIGGNLERCLEAVLRAEGADLVVFPELALTGYPPEDLLARPDFIDATIAAAAVFAARATRPAIIGYVDRIGRVPANAAAFVRNGVTEAVYHKRLLPNYGVFDEERYFRPGDRDVIVSIGDVRCGITICEDIWFPETAERLGRGGAQVVVNLSASPYHTGKGREREAMLGERALTNNLWIAYCNLVGGQDELVFDGRSVVIAPDGTVIARAAAFQEHVAVCACGPGTEPVGADVLTSPADTEEVYHALLLGLGDYVRKNGFTDVVVGLSGGIDSALVATLAADALGPDRVHGVMMPSKYSSEGSVTDARELAAALGIATLQLPIDAPLAAYLDALAPVAGDVSATLTEENLQARIRGTLLMALSNANGWLVLATGNKSELAVGYSTLYGDMAGGFSPIKDVLKTRVYDLAIWRNARGQAIPAATITKAPSAELRPGQVDQDSLPPYDLLDAILRGYIEQDLSASELVAAGHDAATVVRVIAMVDHAEYKRRQAAPGTRVTHKAFGRDRRMPITNRYRG